MSTRKPRFLAQPADPIDFDAVMAGLRAQAPAPNTDPTQSRGAIRGLGDLGVELGSGLARGVKFTADAFGADNAVSSGADAVDKYARSLLSAQAKQEDQEVARIMAEAQDAGIWEQVKAATKSFAVAPFRMGMNALGTSAPTIAAGVAGAAARMGAAGMTGAMAGMGGVQGAGTVKGAIFEAVKAEQMKTPGMTEAEAEVIASRAQEYGGENTGNIVGGIGIGALAGSTGVQPVIARALTGGARQTAGTAVERGLMARAALGLAKEAPIEGLQGGQEMYATNVALQRQGFDVPTFRGVAGNAALEMLVSAPMGAVAGALERTKATRAIADAETADDAVAAFNEATKPDALPATAADAPPAMRPRTANLDVMAEIRGLDREQQQQALGLLATAQSPQASPAVRRFAQDQLDALLLPVRQIPVGEATETLPTGEATELLADQLVGGVRGAFRTPDQIRADGFDEISRAAIPTGEATEIDQPGLEVSEFDAIPVGKATELATREPAGEFPPRATRTGGLVDGQEVDPAGPNAVRAYIDQMRTVNTMQARAFVREFDAGRITSAEIMARVVPAGPQTPQQRIEAAARQAPAQPDPTDLLTGDGMPYGTRAGAAVRARKEGGEVVDVAGGWAVRVQQAQPQAQPFTQPQAPPAAADRREPPPAQAAAPVQGPAASRPTPAAPAVEVGGVEQGKLAEQRQMVEDMIATKRANRQAVPDAWVTRLADIAAKQRGETVDESAIYAAEVPGHPMYDGPPVLRNLVPLKVANVQHAQKALDRALDLEKQALTEFNTATYAMKSAKTASEKKAAQKRMTALQDQGWDQDARDMLRGETIGELTRLVDAATAKFGAALAPTQAPPAQPAAQPAAPVQGPAASRPTPAAPAVEVGGVEPAGIRFVKKADGYQKATFKTNEGMDGQVGIAPPGWSKSTGKSFEVTLDRVGGPKDERGRTKFYPTTTLGKYRTAEAAMIAARAAVEQYREPPPAAADRREAPPAAPVIQNRNRRSAASIQQMQGIAARPDYGRLGFSRDFATGAPVIVADDIQTDRLGKKDRTTDSDGRKINVQYAAVEADEVLASNTADGQAVPEWDATTGPKAIAGNGRVAGLKAAYTAGNAGGYRAELEEDSLHGIDPDVLAGMKSPIIVRVMSRDDITDDIGDVSNVAGQLTLSPVEQARTDVARVKLDSLEFLADGDPTPEAVRRFVQAMPESEQGGLIDSVTGSPNRKAIDRMQAAVFAAAYDSDGLINLMAEAADPEARLVLSALQQAAPKMARLAGLGSLDIRDAVIQAAEAAVNARRQGKPLKFAAQQVDLTAGKDMLAVLQVFADNARSVAPVVAALNRAADFAYNEGTKAATDMFGEVQRADRDAVLNRLRGDDETGSQESLVQPTGGKPDGSDVAGPLADSGREGDAQAPEDNRPADEAGSAQEGLNRDPPQELEDRLKDLRSAGQKWFSDDAEYEGRDYSAEWMALARRRVAGDIGDAKYADQAEALLAEYLAARERAFAPMRQALANERERRELQAGAPDTRTPAARAFDAAAERALAALPDEDLALVGKTLGVSRGRRSRSGFVEAISSNARSDVRAAYLRQAEPAVPTPEPASPAVEPGPEPEATPEAPPAEPTDIERVIALQARSGRERITDDDVDLLNSVVDEQGAEAIAGLERGATFAEAGITFAEDGDQTVILRDGVRVGTFVGKRTRETILSVLRGNQPGAAAPAGAARTGPPVTAAQDKAEKRAAEQDAIIQLRKRKSVLTSLLECMG